jgi:plasmid stabilization system protein ParE
VPEKYRLYITETAQLDLEQIYYYIAQDSLQNAQRFVLELERKAYSLETLPERQPLIAENEYFGTHYRHLIHKKYRIVYRIADNEVFILRIIHGAKLLDI